MVPLFIFLEIREEERKILERAGYFQSITVGVAPIVVVIASVVTFSVHMILGYDLTAAQVTYCSVENILYNIATVAFLLSCFSSSKNAKRSLCFVAVPLWLGCSLAHRSEHLMGVTAADIVLYFAQKALSAVFSSNLPQNRF